MLVRIGRSGMFLTFTFVLATMVGASSQGAVIPGTSEIELLYREFCAGDFKGFDSTFQALPEDSRSQIQVQLLQMLGYSGQKKLFNEVENFSGASESLSESKRVVFAQALMRSKSKDISKITKLLDFNSENATVNAYRLSTLAFVKLLEGKKNDALKDSIDALNISPEIDGGLLLQVFSLGMRDREALRILKRYFQLIDELPEYGPYKKILESYRYSLTVDPYDASKGSEYVVQAYNSCKYEPAVALLYASMLMNQSKFDEALTVLQEQERNNYFRSVYVDLLMAEILIAKGNLTLAEPHLQAAKENYIYLFPSDQKRLDALTSKGGYSKYIFICGLALVGLVLGLFYYRRK